MLHFTADPQPFSKPEDVMLKGTLELLVGNTDSSSEETLGAYELEGHMCLTSRIVGLKKMVYQTRQFVGCSDGQVRG